MSRGKRVSAGAVVVAAVAATALPSSSAQAIGYVVCPDSVVQIQWDGSANDVPGSVGDGSSWEDAYNWDQDCIPGELGTVKDDEVSIPSGATVQLGANVQPAIRTLDNQGTLIIPTVGKIRIIDSATSRVTIHQGLIRGTARFVVTEQMDWQSLAGGASTLMTRRCAPDFGPEDCSVPATTPGVLEIAVGAELNIDGRGVNLKDQYVIENHGTVRLAGDGYIAADYGTAFRNLRLNGDPVPTFTIENDRGYYQGFPSTLFGPSDFTNTGRIVKQSGTGTGVIDADYAKTDVDSPYTGGVTVRSGRLTVLSPSGSFTNQALVKQGAAFANGSPGTCAVANDTSACETIRVTSDDPQAAALALTKVGTKSRKVTLQELDGAANPGGFGVPVYVSSPNATATTASPMVLRIHLDAGTLGAELPADVAQLAKVQRKGSAATPYQALPDCAVTGGATLTQACVDRAGSLAETNAAGGDVVIVVETLQNSRYRVGRIPSAT